MAEQRPTILLAGGGHAHLGVLAHFLNAPPNAHVILVSQHAHTVYSGLLPSWMAGRVAASDIQIHSAALAARAGARFMSDQVIALDPDARVAQLASGEALSFDIASLAIGGENDGDDFAALGERLLLIRPMEAFMARWQTAIAAAVAKGVLRLVIVGGGAGGVELSLAAVAAAKRARIAHDVALVTEEGAFLSGHNSRVQSGALALLSEKSVAVHYGRATGAADGVLLSDGQSLPADWVIAATGSRALAWLAQSGLATDERGFVSVGADLCSVSHPHIFAAGDIIQRADRPLPRSGVHAVKAGPVLAANLSAVAGDGPDAPMQTYDPPEKTLYLLASGDGRALLSYGRWAAFGRALWWLKNAIDTRFIRHYAALTGGE